MSWTVYGEILLTADGSGTTYYQKFIPTNDMILKAIRTWVIQCNDPTYTALQMKLYSNNGGVPRTLIATSSNSPTKASVFEGYNSGMKETYFEFSNIPLKAGESYYFVLNATGYTGNQSSHIAWKHSFPDPVYQSGVNMNYSGILVSPFDLVVIGANL